MPSEVEERPAASAPGARARGPSPLRLYLFALAVAALTFALIEGLASIGLALHAATKDEAIAERLHAKYDPDLGWVNRPNLAIRDLYGPGASLHTNARGFRGTADVANDVPAGKIRAVCSGDSFTLGFGVGDGETWCAQLASLDPRLETVNMGQGGYGADQAFLWYRRDATFRHHVVLFAFIADDFRRMAHDTFFGYGKPVLALEGGALAVKNVPVPRSNPFYQPRVVTGALKFVRQLRVVQLWRTMAGADEAPAPAAAAPPPSDLRPVVARLFQELVRTAESRGARVALVFLPRSIETSQDTDELRQWYPFVTETAAAQGIPVVDLVAAMRALPGAERDALFIRNDASGFLLAAGHYDAKGNAFVARAVYEKLAPALPPR